MIFILFSFYREQLKMLTDQHYCSLHYNMKKIKIISNTSEEEAEICYKHLCRIIDKVSYT